MLERRWLVGVTASAAVLGAIVGCSSAPGNAGGSGGGSGATTAGAGGAGSTASGSSLFSSSGTCTTTSGAGTSGSSGGGTGYSCEVTSTLLHECTLYQGLSSSDLATQMMQCAALAGASGTSCPTADAIGTCTSDYGQETWYSNGATTVAEAEASCASSNGTWSTSGSSATGSSGSSCGTASSTSASSSSSGAMSTYTVTCAGGTCAAGEICCYQEAAPGAQSFEQCGQPGLCANGAVELACSSPTDCPGAVCCVHYTAASVKAYSGSSCAPTCTDTTSELIVCTGDPSACPVGMTCTASTLIPGYQLCEY